MKAAPLPKRKNPARNPAQWIVPALFVMTSWLYWPAMENGFIDGYDDSQYVTANDRVVQGLTPANLRWIWTASVASNWHPLTLLSHILDVQVYGLNPWGHHLTNVLLHAAASVLLFILLRRLSGATWPSAAVAALFAVHPLHVQSVAWISERKDVLGACFWFLTTLAYERYARAPGFRRYWPVLVLFAMGLMAKPMLVTLPCTLLLLDYWPLRRIPESLRDASGRITLLKLVIEKVPLFVICAAVGLITFRIQQTDGSVLNLTQRPLELRVENAFVSYVKYLFMQLWFADLSAFYPFKPPLWWQWSGALAILCAVTAAAVGLAKRYPYFPVGWFWYLGTLVPVIGFVQAGTQAMADRYTYIPSVGLFIMAAWGAESLMVRLKNARTFAIVGAAAALLVFCAGTRLQLGYWRDSESLFRRALEVTSENYLAEYNLGMELYRQGRFDEAERCLAEGIRLYPDDTSGYIPLGNIRYSRGDYAKALEYYRLAAQFRPKEAAPQYSAGMALEKLNRRAEAFQEYADAVRKYEDALQTEGLNATVHFNLGVLLERMGDSTRAQQHYEQAYRINPALPGAREVISRLRGSAAT